MSMSPGHSQEQVDFFESKIRPMLIKHCYKCHSMDGDKIRGGLLLDTREASLQGGDSGPAVVPHNLDESLLYVAMTYEDDSLEMPPKYKLPDSVIADFRKWIEMGAPDPRKHAARSSDSLTYTNTIDVEEGRAEHWAYHKPLMPARPLIPEAMENWSRNGIDDFILAGLSEKGMTPSGDADAATLIRRISFDLIGLPPSLKMVRSFTATYNSDPDKAVRDAVDHLLEQPQFGERWGRHWMDVARYAESTGKESNATYPYAWRYRDWVIDAYNRDLPFDKMITQQLAGDLLEDSTGDGAIATGFLALGVKGLNERNNRQFRFDVVDEQIDTTTRAFLGTSAACARCHDHKFDPIPMSDYYSMAGIFLSSEVYFGTSNAVQNSHATELLGLPASYQLETGRVSLGDMIDQEFQLSLIKERRDEQVAAAREARRAGNNEEANRIRAGLLALNNQIAMRTAALDSFDENGLRKAYAMGMADSREPFDSQILIRGEEDNATKERVSRGFLQVIRTGDERQISADQSGRLQMAKWITSPENPLTARVYANRVWLWLFGEGIVRSVDNFGTTGESPANPELLDFLAVRLIELDWSTKDLIREIMTSRAYRMSSEYREDHFVKDPENRLLWRANKRRLDAESIRDAILAVSGQIDLERPEGSIVAELGPGFIGRSIGEAQLNQSVNYRSVYLPIVRDMVPDSLKLFDFADPSLMAGKREVTTVPSQALYLMNSEFALEAGVEMARFLREKLELQGPQLGVTAYQLAYARPPTNEESAKTRSYFEVFIKTAMESGKDYREARELALSTFCQALLSSAEFRYIN